MGYLFDTNIFIKSKNEMPPDVWPTFWSRISELIRDGKIFSSVKVKEEIEHGNDELTLWMANNATNNFYYEIDSDILQKYSATQNWAQKNPVYTPVARTEYATVADAFLVATASAKGLILVTNETSDPRCKKRVKIPDACNALGVRCCDLNTALRELGVTI
jgi:predicted nucleic acid-binding protein